MANPRQHGNHRTPGWGAWIREQRESRGWPVVRMGLELGVDPSYISLMEVDGYVPRREKVMHIALVLDISVDETLIRAGYVPSLSEDDAAAILDGLRLPGFVPDLRAACQLHDLTPAEQRSVAAFLQGVRMAVAS